VRVVFPASAAFYERGEGIVSEIGVEGLGWLEEHISELPDRQAANARMVLEDIERARQDAREKGSNLVVRDASQLLAKLRGTNTPFFGYINTNQLSTPSPGTFNFSVYFFNPDPTAWISTYIYVFVGPAYLSADVGQALALRDTRFPALTIPDYTGVNLQPNAGSALNVSLSVPKNLEPSTYMANSFLFYCNYFGVEDYFDRCEIPWKVT
jgi:hypothetical protein